ncbi:DNA alkylation repair protein [Coprobacter sp.]
MDVAWNMREQLLKLSDPDKAKVLQRFFKTSKGSYGEGDIFAGIPVPKTRAIAKQYMHVAPEEVLPLLSDVVHECRLLALLVWVAQFPKSNEECKRCIFDLYLSNTDKINNWDLVDLSAYQIVGEYLKDKDRSLLYCLAESDCLWEQRISIVATWKYIREGKFEDTLLLADKLLQHSHDLIQKAVGWMLREVGKRDKQLLWKFLEIRYMMMPRTMLRYAIEKFSPEERAFFMRKN